MRLASMDPDPLVGRDIRVHSEERRLFTRGGVGMAQLSRNQANHGDVTQDKGLPHGK